MRRLTALICSVALVAGLAGCGTGDSDNTLATGLTGGQGRPVNNANVDPVPTPQVPLQDGTGTGMSPRELAFASEVFQLLNDYRVQQLGAGTELPWWTGLATVCQIHTEAMQTSGVITHGSLPGDPGPVPCAQPGTCPAERVTAYSASLPAQDQFFAAGVRENVAMGHRTAVEVLEAWKLSPGHNANLLNPQAAFVGIGFAEGPSPANPNLQGPWWTLVTADGIAVP